MRKVQRVDWGRLLAKERGKGRARLSKFGTMFSRCTEPSACAAACVTGRCASRATAGRAALWDEISQQGGAENSACAGACTETADEAIADFAILPQQVAQWVMAGALAVHGIAASRGVAPRAIPSTHATNLARSLIKIDSILICWIEKRGDADHRAGSNAPTAVCAGIDTRDLAACPGTGATRAPLCENRAGCYHCKMRESGLGRGCCSLRLTGSSGRGRRRRWSEPTARASPR